MYDKAPYFYGTGRRKSSVARVRVYQGTGKVTINDRDIDDYFGLETLKLIVRQPLVATETDQKFDIVCRVAGGGALPYIPAGFPLAPDWRKNGTIPGPHGLRHLVFFPGVYAGGNGFWGDLGQ